jgi:phosphoribosylpyrophosphate synthetase
MNFKEQRENFRNKKIKVLSIAGLIAKAIRKIHENESTSSLFINR